MRTSKKAALLAMAAMLMLSGALASTAVAGKKKKTTIVLNSNPVLSGQQNVKVSGSLNSATSCLAARSMRLFLTDASGTVQSTVDSTTSRSGGTWKFSAKLPAVPTADQRLQVKVKKLAVGKFVCRAALSGLIEIK
jgi:hypothetical protein